MTVDKNLFKSLLHRYATSSPEDVQQVLSLKAQYPYSQLLSILAAKLTADHNINGHQAELQAAAVRAADRTVLKEVFDNEIFFELADSRSLADENLRGTRPKLSETATEQVIELAVSQSETQTDIESPTISGADENAVKKRIVSYDGEDAFHSDSGDLADQVIRDLEKLSNSRHNFEMLFVEYAEIRANDHEPAKENASVVDEPEIPREKESIKARKQRIVELAKARQAAPSPTVEQLEESKRKRQVTDGKASPNEELIEEIITNKQEISPENPKQKEQIDLINHFIKAQPSITSARDKQPAPLTDLNPVKTGEFGDNIVSETLVEILVKQGKKDKAIEVLKKLIWKYPQKKAYFASQIEELKK